MKCDAMPLVYVRILVAGLRWSPTGKSNAGILYPRIWGADRCWNLSASGGPIGKVGQWGADRCWNLSASGRPTGAPIRPLARLAPMPFPRPPALAAA